MRWIQRQHKLWTALVVAALLFLLTGCEPTFQQRSPKITLSFSIQADQPVENGRTVQTEKLGTVHLNPPLLLVEHEGVQTQLFDVKFSALKKDPFLYIPTRLLLSRPGVRGISNRTLLIDKIQSEELSPGRQIYMVIESRNYRFVHQLTVVYEDDPSVFIQSELRNYKINNYGGNFEVRQILEAGDPQATRIEVAKKSTKMYYWVSEPMFSVQKQTWSDGLPWRFSVKTAPDSGAVGKPDSKKWKDIVLSKEMSQSLDGKYVMLTRTEGRNNEYLGVTEAARALFWSSLPGLHFKIESPIQLEEIKESFRSLDTRVQWHSVDFGESGMSSSGGIL
ncbi:MAG: hypothetical protein GWP41_07610 [Planctomycetia bacterium]|nr:hypothetical protein [Planctomycetia bacterium]